MANPSPVCTVSDNGGTPSATTNGVNVTASHTITVQLSSTAGVNVWDFVCVGTDDLHSVATINASISINQSTKTATFTSPSAACALNFRSTVNRGLDVNGRVSASLSSPIGVYVLASNGLRVLAFGETFEGSASYGWTTTLNAAFRALGTGPATPGPSVYTLTPSTVSTLGGTVVIGGANFSSPFVTVNGVTVTASAITSSSITITVPAHAVSPSVPVVVTNGDSQFTTATLAYAATAPITGMLAWLRGDVASVTAGTVTSWTDQSGNANHAVPVGAYQPAYVASSGTAGMNGMPTLQWARGTGSRGLHISGISLASTAFTVYMVHARNSGLSGVYEYLFTGENSLRSSLYTHPDGTVYANGGSQLITGITLSTTAQTITAVFNGASSGFAKSSETYDIAGDAGSFGTSNFIIGDAYSAAGSGYESGSEFAEVIIYAGAHTKSQQQQILAYFNYRYGLTIDKDPPGSIYRAKMSFNTGTPSFPSVTLSSLRTSGGAFHIYTRARAGQDAMPTSGYPQWSWSQDNANAGPWSARMPDGNVTIRNASTDYKPTITSAWDTLHDVEFYTEMGGGLPPRYAFRNDNTLPWMVLPFDAPGNIPNLSSLTGQIAIGGNTQTSPNAYSTHPFGGTIYEIVAYDDASAPPGLTFPTYRTGALVFAGNSITSVQYGGGWPAFCLQLLTHSIPFPRMTGVPGQTTAQMQTGITTQVGQYYVAGGVRNIVTVLEGRNSMAAAIGNLSAATAYSQMVTLCQGLQAQGWKVVIATVQPSSGLDETRRTTYNSSITTNWPTFADALADLAADGTMGQAGQYSLTQWYADGIHPTSQGAKRMAAIFAAAVDSLL